jgi:ABC-type branched-subunit amino acid transport system substrate-binding protein
MKGLNWVVALAATCVTWSAAQAEISDNVVRVGVLNDISGIFQDTNGMGSVEAARMAAEDFAGGGKNIKVEIVYADHQNKADVGSAIVRKWLDVDGVDAIVDVPNSAVGLTINSLLRDTRMTFLASSTASSDLTGKACSPNTIQWVNDAWATGNTTAAAMMARGGKDWYFVTVNYALGQGIEAEATNYIEKHGGKVLGSSKHPLGTSDFASFLLQAQNSKAKVIGLANAGGDTINAVKQAAEFGIQQGGQTMVAFLLFVNDVHGAATAGSLLLGHGRRYPRLCKTLCGTSRHERQDAERQPGRRLCLHAGLPQRRSGNRQRRCQGRGAADEEVQGQGQTVRRRHHPPGRPRHPSDVSVRGQEAGRVEISVRLLQTGFDDSGGAGVPAARGWRMFAGEVV